MRFWRLISQFYTMNLVLVLLSLFYQTYDYYQQFPGILKYIFYSGAILAGLCWTYDEYGNYSLEKQRNKKAN